MTACKLPAAALLATAATGALAGRPCEAGVPFAMTVQPSMALAERTAADLATSRAQVAVLARAGRNVGECGLRWSHTDQQRHPWAFETVFIAQASDAGNRLRTHASLQTRGCERMTLRIPPMKRLGAGQTSAHAAFDDHPHVNGFCRRIEAVTADSVFSWLVRSSLAGPVQVR